MAWRRTGDKPLPGPMMTQSIDAYMRHYGGDELKYIVITACPTLPHALFSSNTTSGGHAHFPAVHKAPEVTHCCVLTQGAPYARLGAGKMDKDNIFEG